MKRIPVDQTVTTYNIDDIKAGFSVDIVRTKNDVNLYLYNRGYIYKEFITAYAQPYFIDNKEVYYTDEDMIDKITQGDIDQYIIDCLN